MKLTDPRPIPTYLQEAFTYSAPIESAIKSRIDALEAKQTPATLSKFTRITQTFIKVMAEKRLPTGDLQRLYIKAMEETAQVLSRPVITDLEFDTFAALDQPEIVTAFANWEYPEPSVGLRLTPPVRRRFLR